MDLFFSALDDPFLPLRAMIPAMPVSLVGRWLVVVGLVGGVSWAGCKKPGKVDGEQSTETTQSKSTQERPDGTARMGAPTVPSIGSQLPVSPEGARKPQGPQSPGKQVDKIWVADGQSFAPQEPLGRALAMYCNPDYQTCDPPDEPSPPDDVLYVLGGASHYDSRPVQLGHKGDDTWLIPIPEGRAVELAYTHGETDNTVGHRLESTESVVKGRIHYLQMKVHWWFNAYLSANYGIVVYLTKTKNVQQIQPVVKCDTALVISACEGNISGIIFDSWWDNASGD